MRFLTSLGGMRTVCIPDPVENVSVAAINLAAERIIEAQPFDETVGLLLSLADGGLHSAHRVITERIPLLP